MNTLWPAFWLSLRIALSATLVAMILAVPLAYFMARRKFPAKSLLEALILTPLVLPPTVVGYFIIILFGAHGWLGTWFSRAFGYSIMFRFEGAVLAATVVALPLLYIPVKAAFAAVDRELEDIARLYGANSLQLFWHVSVPLARRGLVGGLLLAFGRALGEFGATVMVFGLQPKRTTLPISIWADFEQGQLDHALPAVVALSALSVVLLIVYNASSIGRQER